MWIFSNAHEQRILENRLLSDPPSAESIALQVLLETSCTIEDASRVLCSGFDSTTGMLSWLDASGNAQAVGPVGEDLMWKLKSLMRDDNESLLWPLKNQTQFESFVLTLLDECDIKSIPVFQKQIRSNYTRFCLDPWQYMEITTDGKTKPCCRYFPQAQIDTEDVSMHSQMEQDERIALQERLLNGSLDSICSACHIRKMVPVTLLQERVRVLKSHSPNSIPIPTELRIDITGRCNLRCVYCGVTDPSYSGKDMDSAYFDTILSIVDSMAPNSTILVNGHGETTYHPKWLELCNPIIERGRRPEITTNLAKNFAEEEIEALSRFKTVQVSLDSNDTKMMRNIRKAVTPERILQNVNRIRCAGRRNGHVPTMALSVGLYDPSIWCLPSFVDWIVSNGFQHVTFWSLVEKDHQVGVRSLRRLDREEVQKVKDILSLSIAKMNQNNLRYEFAGDFVWQDGTSLIEC